MVNVQTLKDIDYAGYTERFRALQVRHLNNVLSLERLGRLMDAEILGANNYKALDLLRDMNWFMERNRYEYKCYDLPQKFTACVH
jgi:hypothetical protein